MPDRMRLCFVVESGTDVRLVEGLAERTELTVLGRSIPGGRIVSQEPKFPVDLTTGPSSRVRFSSKVFLALAKRGRFDAVIVQGYGLAAFAANLASRLCGVPTFMLICSPVELYYRCRKHYRYPEMPYKGYQLRILEMLARFNARIGRHYLTLSRHLRDIVRNHGTRRPVSIVPVYGVDSEVFKAAFESRATLRTKYDLPVDGELITRVISAAEGAEKAMESIAAAAAGRGPRGRAAILTAS